MRLFQRNEKFNKRVDESVRSVRWIYIVDSFEFKQNPNDRRIFVYNAVYHSSYTSYGVLELYKRNK